MIPKLTQVLSEVPLRFSLEIPYGYIFQKKNLAFTWRLSLKIIKTNLRKSHRITGSINLRSIFRALAEGVFREVPS